MSATPRNPDPDNPVTENDFYSFDNALDKLELAEDDLKRLISAGEIRAFRDGSQMRLRAEDVSRVATDLGVGGEVAEEDAGEVLEVEEVVLDEADDAGMVTTQLSEEDTLLDDPVEEVAVGEVVASAPRARTPRAAAPAEEAQKESTGILFASVATTAVMVWGLAFVLGMLNASSSSVTESLVNALK